MNKLTPKQRRFVDEYLVDLNGKQAAIRAGYSPRSAHEISHENMMRPHVAAAIDAAKQERAERTKIDADWVLFQSEQLFYKCKDSNNLAGAARCLEIIGKHVEVKAFQERVEVTSTVAENLSERLFRARNEIKADRERRLLEGDPPGVRLPN